MSATVFTVGHYDDAGALDRKFYLPFSKLDATAAPGVTDDDAAGFVAGSIWADRTGNKVYLCTDNGTGAATWVEAGASGGSGTVTHTAGALSANYIVIGNGGADIKVSSVQIDVSGNITGATTVNKVVITQPATGSTLTIDDGKALVVSNTITLAGTDGNTLNINDGVTLSQLAATAWAANTLAIGSGAGTVAQVTFAANTFPARASTGNLVAKTISDFALTILDDADAAAVRTTIGAGTGSGTVTSVNLTQPAAGITVSGGPITTSGSITLALADDLAALEALTGTNTIYYRSAASTWTAVTIGTGLSFTTGTLFATGGSGTVTNVSNSDDTLTVATGTTTPVVSLNTDNIGFNGGIWNLGFTYSASGGMGTLTLTTAAGGTPSATDKGAIVFDGGGGTTNPVSVTATVSLTISSGATLGSDGSWLRVWVVLFNDSGTLRLGVINCRNGTNITPLTEGVSASSTAMDSGADSAGVIYTNSAVSAKYYRVIGYFEIDSLTPGTWVSASRSTLRYPGVPLPGTTIQHQRTLETSYVTSTATIPIDDSKAQSSEGSQYFSQAITPKAAANVLRASTYIWCYCSVAATAVIYAIFRDSGADALQQGDATILSANYRQPFETDYECVSGTTSSTSLKLRMGGSGASTIGVNGFAGSRYYGGAATSWFQVEEIQG